jgi:hypothetical protein
LISPAVYNKSLNREGRKGFRKERKGNQGTTQERLNSPRAEMKCFALRNSRSPLVCYRRIFPGEALQIERRGSGESGIAVHTPKVERIEHLVDTWRAILLANPDLWKTPASSPPQARKSPRKSPETS